MPCRLRLWPALLMLLCILVPLAAHTQQTTKRLILKDGSYQIVTKYEIKGDRVHYYSAERSEWEDIPDDLIDWKATAQYEKERAEGKKSPEAEALDKELEAEQQQDEAQSPHVAPGLRLPSEGGVYALDTYLGEPQLLPLDQNNGEVNRQVKRNLLRAAINPVGGSKHTIELSGPRAKTQVHASLPAVYINLEPLEEQSDESAVTDSGKNSAGSTKAKQESESASELPWDRFRIVKVQVKGDKRIVGAIKTAVYGKVSQEQNIVPATAEALGTGWIKLTPKAPLEPGEYALAEMLGKEGMNSYVWDFGVHPDAPANLAVIRPEKPAGKASGQRPQEPKTR